MAPLLCPPRSVVVVRWIARLLSAWLFLLWGAFFVEHLQWFAIPGEWPPVKVFLLQLLHLTLLAGLALAWKWEFVGSIVILASAAAFFSQTAGQNFFMFWSITTIPAIMWLYCCWRTRMTIH